MWRLCHVNEKRLGNVEIANPSSSSSDMHERLRRVNTFKVIFGRLTF